MNWSPEFIRRIPKTDLHLHLDGSLRLETMLELAEELEVRLPADSPDGLKHTVFKEQYANLAEYLRGFAVTNSVMTTPEALERIARELVEDNIAEGVRYCEIRFAPQLHINERMRLADVVRAVARGLTSARDEFNRSEAVRAGADLPFEGGLITCAMRSFHENMGSYYTDLMHSMSYMPRRDIFAVASSEMARAAVWLIENENLPIVGFDLAGEEAGYPAVVHRDAYLYAHRHFLRKTVHAGEAYGPESIFQAITECHANRIGHGTHLFAPDTVQDPDIREPEVYCERLAEYIANQRITLEVCLTSNLQTLPSLADAAAHPVRHMIDHNLSVSICTDNRLVSHTTVSRELQRLTEAMPLTRNQFRNLVIAGFKGSFFPGSYNDKRAYVRRVIDRYEQLEREWLPAGPDDAGGAP